MDSCHGCRSKQQKGALAAAAAAAKSTTTTPKAHHQRDDGSVSIPLCIEGVVGLKATTPSKVRG